MANPFECAEKSGDGDEEGEFQGAIDDDLVSGSSVHNPVCAGLPYLSCINRFVMGRDQVSESMHGIRILKKRMRCRHVVNLG